MAVHGQSSTDHNINWRPQLQPHSSHVAYNSSHFGLHPRLLSNGSLMYFPSSSEDANNDVIALVLYAVLSVLGTTVNIFEISSLIIQENLRHHGNAFLANQALANLLITTIGFPASCIAILSRSHRYPFVCYWQWYSGLISFFTSTVNFFFISFENLLRSRRKSRRERTSESGAYSYCCGVQIVVIAMFFSWFAAIAWVLVLVFYDNSHDVCNQEYGYSLIFLIFLIPNILTIFTFGLAIHRYKQHLNELESRQCLESREESLHRQLFKSNALAYLLFLCFWMPFTIAVSISTSETPTTQSNGYFSPTMATIRTRKYVSASPNTVETLLGIAQSYSCFCGLVYAFTNGSFGQAFIYLTRYFCCKAHPEFSRNTFQEKTRGTVRVHIGMETRVGERNARASKLMSVSLNDSPYRGGGGSRGYYL